MRIRLRLAALALAAVLCGFVFLGCDSNVDATYTVWTDTDTYAAFQSAFNTTLDDGMYLYREYTQDEWEQASPSLTEEGRHEWTKEKIKDWFLGRGFDDYEATKRSAWLTTIEHGFIVSRTGNIVYIILK